MLTTHLADQTTLDEHVEGLALDHVSRNIPVYDGFHYFCTLDLDVEAKYVLLKENGTLVAVLKYDRFRNRDERAETGATHLGIFFVDVHRDHRRRGLSRALVQALRDAVPDQDVHLSPLTNDGKQAKLAATFATHFRVQLAD